MSATEVTPGEGGRIVEIRRAAARLFHEQGYTATSIQDVAEAVGMLKGSLYYHIDSKEALLFEIIQSAHEASLANVRRLRDSDGDALDVLHEFIAGHVVSNADNLESMGVFFHDFRHLSDEHRDVIVAERDEYDAFVRDLIDRGRADGSIDPDTDTRQTAKAILGMMNWVYQWYRPGGPRSAEEVGSSIADLATRGLAAR